MHRSFLLELLSRYKTHIPAEVEMQNRLTLFVEQHPDCFARTLSIGHITGSAWVVNKTRNRVFLLHHRKLDKWLQPGGHSDGDSNTLNVALRETQEESGVSADFIHPVTSEIFDIDIHHIPERKNEAAHFHYDVRFLLEMDDKQQPVISDESNELAWIDIEKVHTLTNEESITRMIAKTKHLLL